MGVAYSSSSLGSFTEDCGMVVVAVVLVAIVSYLCLSFLFSRCRPIV
jgi:hypothetical protein